MKIVELLFSLTPGGAERFVVDLSNELSLNHDVTILTIKDDRVDSETRKFYLSQVNKNVKYINLTLPDGFSLKSQWDIYKTIKELNPDVVHLNSCNLPQFCALAIFLLSRKIKFFQTIHNDLHNGYDSGFFRLFANTFGRFKNLKYITISETNHKDMKEFYPYCCFDFIQNGRAKIQPSLEFDKVKNEVLSHKKDNDTVIFLHVARCNEQKNQHLLIDSFNELIEKGLDAILLIIGAGFDSELGRQLKAKSCDSIVYLGTRKNVGDYMLCADFFCLSSSFEGMPITLLEASLSGIPAVSTPVCGAVDVIQNGVNGIICKDFSQKEYVTSLENAINLKNTLRKNSELQKDNSPYDIKNCAEHYEKLFIGV